MDEKQTTNSAAEEHTSESGQQLVDELNRLGRKLMEVVDTAWNSDQRRQIQEEIRTGLNRVAESLESGIKEVSEKEQTMEVIGKASDVADDVVEKVRDSEIANEIAAGLATGFRTLGDQLDKIASDMRATHPQQTGDASSSAESAAQDIPISNEEADHNA